jgi:hypothetical protein
MGGNMRNEEQGLYQFPKLHVSESDDARIGRDGSHTPSSTGGAVFT